MGYSWLSPTLPLPTHTPVGPFLAERPFSLNLQLSVCSSVAPGAGKVFDCEEILNVSFAAGLNGL